MTASSKILSSGFQPHNLLQWACWDFSFRIAEHFKNSSSALENWWIYQGILRHQHCPALLGTSKQGFHNPGQSAQTDGPLLLYWHFNRVWLWSQTDESDRMSWNKQTGGVEVKGCFVQKWYSSHGPLTTVKKHLLTKSICGMFLWTATLTTCF